MFIEILILHPQLSKFWIGLLQNCPISHLMFWNLVSIPNTYSNLLMTIEILETRCLILQLVLYLPMLCLCIFRLYKDQFRDQYMYESVWQIHQWLFHCKSNSKAMYFNPNYDEGITIKFCSWHDIRVLLTCAKIDNDLIAWKWINKSHSITLITRFMGPIWGPSGADRTQVGPMLAPWTLLSGKLNHIWIVLQWNPHPLPTLNGMELLS